MMELSAERLREVLHYDVDTGIFTWSAKSRNRRFAGKIAGRIHKKRGYCEIHVDGRLYYAHRLAFLYMTGKMPVCEVDHINHSRSDNRWTNLREASVSLNQQNRKAAQSNNISGLLGVSMYRSGNWLKWRARINADGREKTIGYFDTPEDAQIAYLAAKRKLHAGCTI